jgi:AcrR family transcriptional regulator
MGMQILRKFRHHGPMQQTPARGDLTRFAAEAVGGRDEKRRATSRGLADAAFRLATEKGFDGFVVEDVTASAGYSRRTFANHYSCKEDAVASVLLNKAGAAVDASDLSMLASFEGTDIDLLELLLLSAVDTQLVDYMISLRHLLRTHEPLLPYVLAVGVPMTERISDVIALAVGPSRDTLTTSLLIHSTWGAVIAVLRGVYDPWADATTDDERVDALRAYWVTTFDRFRTGFGPLA